MSFNFASFGEGAAFATAAIVAAEIKFNYGLGDKAKDLALKVFGKAKASEESVASEVKKL